MIEITADNPWTEHLQGLEAELSYHERAADSIREQYTRDLDRATIWQTEAAEQEYNDAASAADRDEQEEWGQSWFPPPNSNN